MSHCQAGISDANRRKTQAPKSGSRTIASAEATLAASTPKNLEEKRVTTAMRPPWSLPTVSERRASAAAAAIASV